MKVQNSKKKILLMTDLDNTMIYSHRRNIGADKVAVELYEGRIVSYMTRFSFDSLEKTREDILFVPISTRSVKQYERIKFANDGWIPHFALVSNGGTLLVDGKSNEKWKRESLSMISETVSALKECMEILEHEESRTLDVRMVDDLFVFTKCDRPRETLVNLTHAVDSQNVDFFINGKKVYVLPKALNKGRAVERFTEYLSDRNDFDINQMHMITAGDSLFDLSLVEKGEISFFPEELAVNQQELPSETKEVKKNQITSDEIFKYIDSKKK